jgi:hypothetical protein
MTFSPHYNRQTGEPYPRQLPKDEGYWSRVHDFLEGWMWKRKGYKVKDEDLRKKGITNWASLGEDMQWKIAEEINRERVQKLYDDTLKRVKESQEARKKWQDEHGTN